MLKLVKILTLVETRKLGDPLKRKKVKKKLGQPTKLNDKDGCGSSELIYLR